MHISDGVLSPQVWVSGYVVTGALTAYVLARKTDISELPRVSIVTALLPHIKIHMNGLGAL